MEISKSHFTNGHLFSSNSVPNILKYHRIYVDAKKPGIVMLRQDVSSADSMENILKVDHQSVLDGGMPQLTCIKGLDAQRQWYLFEQIRPFCKSNLTADFTCPQPSFPKPDAKSSQKQSTKLPEVSHTTTSASNSRGKRKCSQCHEYGHTKRTCKGINQS